MKILHLFFLTSSLCAESNWQDYQAQILLEQPNFSGWCPQDKAKHLMDILYKNPSDVCVELGVYGGSSFFPIAATLCFKNEGIAYAIDPWSNTSCVEGYQKGDKFDNFWGKLNLNKVLHKFIDDMHKNNLDLFYVLMRSSSAQSLKFFEDDSIDFLHIDGNHSEQAALFDVANWLPKVKKNGIICFDDAWWASTQPAIKLLLEESDIMPESSPKWQYIFVRKR